MAVMAGYKQSEVGVIPEDWSDMPIGKLMEFKNGLNKAKHFFGEGTPIVNYMDVFQNPGMTAAKLHSKVTVTFEERRNYSAKAGDVFFTRTSETVDEIGTSSVLLEEVEGAVFSGFLLRGRPISESLSLNYKKYCFGHEIVRKQIRSTSSYTTRALTNGKLLSRVRVPLPPTKAEQEAIAGALSDADALIESLEQLIAKKRHIKQGAMQELLTGKKRLPGFAGSNKFKTDELGSRPIDWKTIRLKDVVDESRGIRYGIVQPGKFDPTGRYMIRGQDYSESKGWAKPSDVFQVSDGIEARYRNARVREGDLIMTIVGYCGHVEMVPNWLDGANLTQTTARIAIQRGKASPSFCKYLLQSTVGKSQVATFIKGAAQPGLNCGDVEEFLLPLPPLPEQAAIATILSDMDTEIAALETKLAKTRSLKQGMMHNLLTGRIRLV